MEFGCGLAAARTVETSDEASDVGVAEPVAAESGRCEATDSTASDLRGVRSGSGSMPVCSSSGST